MSSNNNQNNIEGGGNDEIVVGMVLPDGVSDHLGLGDSLFHGCDENHFIMMPLLWRTFRKFTDNILTDYTYATQEMAWDNYAHLLYWHQKDMEIIRLYRNFEIQQVLVSRGINPEGGHLMAEALALHLLITHFADHNSNERVLPYVRKMMAEVEDFIGVAHRDFGNPIVGEPVTNPPPGVYFSVGPGSFHMAPTEQNGTRGHIFRYVDHFPGYSILPPDYIHRYVARG